MIAVENVEVARALRYIWEHYQDTLLCTDSILAFTNLSRRPLEIAFHRELGRTINAEIIRTRLENTKKYLIHTDYTVAKIAREVGLSHPPQLYRIFQKYIGITPQAYRKKMRSESDQ